MLIDVKAPELAESVSDATIVNWTKSVGDRVTQGEHLADLETDKVTLEVSAPVDGVLKDIGKVENDTVNSGEVIAVIVPGAGDTPAEEAPAETAGMSSKPKHSGRDEGSSAPPKLGPAVRKLLSEHQLQAGDVPASKQGRLTPADVRDHLASKPEAVSSGTPVAEPATGEQVVAETGPGRQDRAVPMTRLRKRIAQRLLAAQHENAILTTFNEVDMKAVMDLRTRYRESFEKAHSVKLGFMSFFVRACVQALKQFPEINASISGEDVVYHDYFDIGIAVSSLRGLVVPVLRDAETLSFHGIEAEIAEFARKAKANALSLEEMTGGTFTITNGGIFGSLLSTPILNPPQSAILGMHKIQERPVVVGGEIAVRPIMYLALSYDHRLIDGREAVRFLVTVKEQLEDPSRMLLDV
ncbi:MAG: 2-oxoglutarate dehydrogenase complex dihydrolipoyllysine-residue succinyltransferase [Gammaproteobacteria bacterium]|nr:2-oxoglutarate dehydrogenase complex dihydrolipoyllysine-residue succinyltransferase [Gammaproteobacteria bacterium]